MATTTYSKAFCFRTNRRRRLLKLIPIALLMLFGVIFAIKVQRKLTKLSYQFDSLNIQYYDLQHYSVQLAHLTRQVDLLNTQINIQRERESVHDIELKSIQMKYQGDIDRLKLSVQQSEALVRDLSEKYASLQQANSELTQNLNLFRAQTSETLREAKAKLDKVNDSGSLKKESEALLEEFLRNKFFNLFQIHSVNDNHAEEFDQNERKILVETGTADKNKIYDTPDFDDPFDEESRKTNGNGILGEDKASVIVNKVDSSDPLYTEETQNSVKIKHFQPEKDQDSRETYYRFTQKGLEDSTIINEINFSDPFDTEDGDPIKIEYPGSNKVRDWIDTSYRFTKASFETVKDYVKERGPKIAEEVERVSKRKVKQVNDYVSEAIPKASKKIKDLSEKTKEITERVGINILNGAEKLAGKARKIARSLYNMMRQ